MHTNVLPEYVQPNNRMLCGPFRCEREAAAIYNDSINAMAARDISNVYKQLRLANSQRRIAECALKRNVPIGAMQLAFFIINSYLSVETEDQKSLAFNLAFTFLFAATSIIFTMWTWLDIGNIQRNCTTVSNCHQWLSSQYNDNPEHTTQLLLIPHIEDQSGEEKEKRRKFVQSLRPGV